jgi:hypothetical protein
LAGVLSAAQRVRRSWKKRPVTVLARFTSHRIEPHGGTANGLAGHPCAASRSATAAKSSSSGRSGKTTR